MSEKIKGITITSVYEEKKFKGEVNDEPSETVTTGYIPIDEQVKMIMKGQITVGNLDRGFEDADDDIEKESPEEVFEDAVDLGSVYQDDLREALAAETSASQQANISAQTEIEKTEQASQASDAKQASEASE